MGRFYRTANANPIDFIHRINAPLMERVLNANDEYISTVIGENEKSKLPLDYNYLAQDAEDANAITSQYNKEIDEITSNIKGDAANWRSQVDNIRKLRQRVVTDFKTGAISKQMDNYNKRKAIFDDIDERVKLYNTSGGDKGLNPTTARYYKTKWDLDFTGTKYNSKDPNSYNVYKGGNVLNTMNIPKLMEEGIDKIKADKTKEYHEDLKGLYYFDKITNSKTYVTPERIIQAALGNLTPQMIDYLRQESEVGSINRNSVFDESGKLIEPYSNNNHVLTEQESSYIADLRNQAANIKGAEKDRVTQQIDDLETRLKSKKDLSIKSDTYLGNILNGLVNKYAYSETESGNDLSSNPVGIATYNAGQAWARQTRSLNQAKELADMREAGINERFNKRLTFGREKENNKGTKGTTKSTDLPSGTTISKMGINSLESDYTTLDNGKKVLTYSPEGVAGNIVKYKNSLANIDSELATVNKSLEKKPNPNSIVEMADYTQNIIRKNELEQQRKQTSNKLEQTREIYKATSDVAINGNSSLDITGLNQEEKDLYTKYDNDREGDKKRAEIKRLEQKYPKVAKSSDFSIESSGSKTGQTQYIDSPQVVEARKDLEKYENVKRKVDNNRNKAFGILRKDYFDTDTIKPNQQDSDDISSMILEDTKGLELFDGATGKPTTNIVLDSDGVNLDYRKDNYNMDFTQGSLKEYIEKNKVKMNILNVGKALGIGTGNTTIEVTFDDPNGEIPKGKSYFISTSSRLQSKIANKFRNNSNKDIANLAAKLDDVESNSIRNQFKKADLTTITNKTDDKKFNIFFKNTLGDDVSLEVLKLPGGKLRVEYIDKDGKIRLLPKDKSVNRPDDGFFNSPEDLIDSIKRLKNE